MCYLRLKSLVDVLQHMLADVLSGRKIHHHSEMVVGDQAIRFSQVVLLFWFDEIDSIHIVHDGIAVERGGYARVAQCFSSQQCCHQTQR
jgi:hypothetical protein